jgi:hypothetical protein
MVGNLLESNTVEPGFTLYFREPVDWIACRYVLFIKSATPVQHWSGDHDSEKGDRAEAKELLGGFHSASFKYILFVEIKRRGKG